MRHLLFLAHRIPYPPNKGDKIRSYNILRHLASRFKVHLGCFFDDPADERYIEPLRELCSAVFCLPLAPARKAIRGIRGVVFGRSISEACYQDRRMKLWTGRTLERHDIRDIFVFCSSMAPYAREHRNGRRVILDMVDVDSEKWAAYARSANVLLRPLYRFEQRHLLAVERRAGAACTRLLFATGAEAASFLTLAPELSGRVSYLENGVDLSHFDPARAYPNPFGAVGLPIVFTGAMNYRANSDAVAWFAHEAFPAIRKIHQDAEFWIVGGHPSASVRQLSRSAGVQVTGTVADTRPFLAHASCAVAPLRVARGVQNKVLEAMAMAKPVVLTPAALEGVHATPGREVLIAGTSADLARCISEVLQGQWTGLGSAARRRVKQDHSWPQNLKMLDMLFPESFNSAELETVSEDRPLRAEAN